VDSVVALAARGAGAGRGGNAPVESVESLRAPSILRFFLRERVSGLKNRSRTSFEQWLMPLSRHKTHPNWPVRGAEYAFA
jgi:hypothetical protein